MESSSDEEEVFLNFLILRRKKRRRKEDNGTETFSKIEKLKSIHVLIQEMRMSN